MQALVSIIIPVYNMERFVAETLDSVLKTNYPNFEVVCVDDGSKDNSLKILREYEQKDSRVRVFSKENGGVCSARNMAIENARGEFVLPVDSDNLIEPTFVERAAQVLSDDSEVKLVVPRADLFGERSGEWITPDFDINLLARKNIIDNCAMYRRADWLKIGGYCREIMTREDWDFWISLLKDGGKVVRLNTIEFHYRFRSDSKRNLLRKKKTNVVEMVNLRHIEFFQKVLGGPLRQNRTWSKFINFMYRLSHPCRLHLSQDFADFEYFMKALPHIFKTSRGKVLYHRRNEIRDIEYKGHQFVVKSFAKPNIINKFVYGIFRPSKAKRSFDYAEMLIKKGLGSPKPVGYFNERFLFLFSKSYFVTLLSDCNYTYSDLLTSDFGEDRPAILKAIANYAARLHNLGMLHKDHSRGNILFKLNDDKTVDVEMIDLNRIRFYDTVTMEMGCQNFAERLPASDNDRKIMAEEYAKVRNLNADDCLKLMLEFNKEKK